MAITFENIDFRCIKGIPKSSVETRTLSEMGFPVDAPPQPDMSLNLDFINYASKVFSVPLSTLPPIEKFYLKSLLETRSREKAFALALSELASTNMTAAELTAGFRSNCIFDLEASDAETLIEEFVFIIKELLPRQLSDVYYSFDLEPNPAYSIFFDLAAEKLNLQKYDVWDDPRYGQFVSHTEEGISKRFEAGESLISIYQNTCATKEIIKDTISKTPHNTYDAIEVILFSLSKQYSYIRKKENSDEPADFYVYKDGAKILNIIFLSQLEYDHIDDYEQYLSELALDDDPLLVLDHYEYYSEYFSKVIRKALKDPEYIQVHSEERSRCFKYEKAIRYCTDNYQFAKTAKVCGCFACGELFAPEDIEDWHLYEDEERGGYAYCPCCGDNAVIMDSQGYEITEEFLELIDHYFATCNDRDYW